MDNSKINIEYVPISPTEDDILEIKALCYYFWEEEGIYSENFYEKILDDNLSLIYKDNGCIIAICLAEQEEKKIDIAVLCVKKEYQRKGLGKSLLNHCIENGIKKGFNEFYLHVCTTNQGAINLYKKVGFEQKEFIENYYSNDPPPNNNAYLMELIKNKKIERKEINKDENNENENELCLYNNLPVSYNYSYYINNYWNRIYHHFY